MPCRALLCVPVIRAYLGEVLWVLDNPPLVLTYFLTSVNALPTVLRSYCSGFPLCSVKDELKLSRGIPRISHATGFFGCFFASISNQV